MKNETVISAGPIKAIEINGKPRRLANMDASVCSFHVIGSQ
jgi:hypothetical protein